jgi:hypothetical protein
MTIRRKMVLPLALAIGALTVLVVAQGAMAGHVRPKSASPLRASLVPAFKQCQAASANRQHGPPLGFPSCNPPVPASSHLTIGEPTVNGAAANAVGFIKLTVKVGVPGPPEDSDVLIVSSGTDVRCQAGVATCGAANAQDGPDYTGQLQGTAQIRISDHWNAVAAGGGADPATVIDIPFPVNASCVATASTSVGGTCSANTSANAVVAGSVLDGKRAVVEIGQLQINDGGASGTAGAADTEVFEVQGIFIP